VSPDDVVAAHDLEQTDHAPVRVADVAGAALDAVEYVGLRPTEDFDPAARSLARTPSLSSTGTDHAAPGSAGARVGREIGHPVLDQL